MAFFAKFGGLLRHNSAQAAMMKSGLGAGAAAVPAMLMAQRFMSSPKLFIGGVLLDFRSLKLML